MYILHCLILERMSVLAGILHCLILERMSMLAVPITLFDIRTYLNVGCTYYTV